MNLFELKDYKVTFSPQALLLKPFKDIWDADKTKHKEIAVKELSFMWFFCDIMSTYLFIKDADDRTNEIKKDVGLPLKWKPNKKVLDAIDFYLENDPSMARVLYRAAISSVDIISKKLNETDKLIKDSRDEITSLAKITALLEKIPKVMSELKKAERQIVKEQIESQDESQNMFEMTFDKML